MSAALIDTAREMHAHGVNVIPVRHDGTKAPALRAWQTHTTTTDDLDAWFGGEHPRHRAIGATCGRLSGGLELLEIEGAHVDRLESVGAAAGAAGLLELWERVNTGWCEQSPSGGVHWFYRVDGADVPGNVKLAATEDRETIAETRGQGGQVVLAPTGGTAHRTGKPWTRLEGGPATVPTLTVSERDALHGLFRALDRTPARTVEHRPAPTLAPADGARPGDLYAARTTWDQLLTRHGWQIHHRAGAETHWTRPGKSTADGPSATTREDGGLFVFSTSTAFDPETPYSKFGALAVLEHGGDHAAAARALAAEGYTERTTTMSAPTVPEAVTGAPGDAERYSRDRAIAEAAERLRVTEAARRMVAAERAAQAPPPVPVDLGKFIAAHADDEASWLLEDLWPLGGRIMLTAPAKGGKTTMMGNLVRTLADGAPFLDRFAPVNLSETGGRVVLLDTEMTEGHLARWLRAVQVRHPERVRVVSLRGRVQTLDPTEPANRAQWTRILAGAQTVILDPVGPVLAALGLEENSSTDVGGFFTGWDALMAEAGVENSLIVHHHGHGGERARGSSKFADSCDALWTLTRKGDADDAPRYFKAMGRDVSVPEGVLEFTPSTRALSYAEGNRVPSEAEAHDHKVAEVIAAMDTAHLSADVTREQLRAFLKDRGVKARNEVLAEAIRKRRERQ